MKTKLPNWPLTKIDELSFKRILLDWLKSILKKNETSIKMIENKEKIVS